MTRYPCSTCQLPGQTDDHPKIHYGAEHYHYDCLPVPVKADVLGDQSEPRQALLAKIIAEAERAKGKSGADLRALIVATNPNGA